MTLTTWFAGFRFATRHICTQEALYASRVHAHTFLRTNVLRSPPFVRARTRNTLGEGDASSGQVQLQVQVQVQIFDL